jgi:ketosteroid isomerase-like protein
MSEEPSNSGLVDRVRLIFEAADRADWDEILRFYAPGAVWESMGMGTFEGVTAIRALWEDYDSSYEEVRIEAEEILYYGNGVVLCVNLHTARPPGSAQQVRRRVTFVYCWVEGLVTRVSEYADSHEARAAAERLAKERE